MENGVPVMQVSAGGQVDRQVQGRKTTSKAIPDDVQEVIKKWNSILSDGWTYKG